MADVNDMDLLRDYADRNSEIAFAELIRRQLNFVYSVALRYLGNSHDAQEVAQAVFVILARKATSLRQRTSLTGGLYETTRLTARQHVRTRARQQTRDQEAYMQSTLNESGNDSVWQQLAPLLEEGMSRLNEQERHLLALRYFEKKSGAETAAALGLKEWAARKRADRAVEKLRLFFARRGIVLTAAVLVTTISTNSIQAAPATLAKNITSVALAKGATAGTSTLTLIKGTLKIMAWTKTKTTLVASLGVLLAVGTTGVILKEIALHRPAVWQEKYDLSYVKTMPPQVTILPSLPSTLQSHTHVMGGNDGKGIGLGQSVSDLLMVAHGVHSGQLILKTPLPQEKYDLLANLPGDNFAVLRKTINEKFGLSVRRVSIETNVLILTVQTPNAAGLRQSSGQFSGDQEPDSYSAHDQILYSLVDYLERTLGTVIVNQTKLKGSYDIDLKWDGTPEGLKQVLLTELGLQLTPGRKAVDFLVVEKAK